MTRLPDQQRTSSRRRPVASLWWLVAVLAVGLAPGATAEDPGPRVRTRPSRPATSTPAPRSATQSSEGLFSVVTEALSSCCTASGGVGCDDSACTDLICGADPCCCFNDGVTCFGWDQICADEAASSCSVCGGSLCPGTQSCCSGNQNNDPKCSDSSCCGVVCELDPFCCIVAWDGGCATMARDLCGSCNGAVGDCCSVHANVGCNSESCEQAVCADNPDCCTLGWDAFCVAAALEVCSPSDCLRSLTVAIAGTGTGGVTATGIACPGDCSESYGIDAPVTLTAASTGGSDFAGWSGDCSGSSTTCDLTMSVNRSATATFNPGPQILTVSVNTSGGATGNVTATGIDCPNGADCTQSYPWNTVVTLTEAPGGGSIFTGWSGGCSGTATTCQVTMSQARSVTASFTPPAQTLGVIKAGTGTGSITATGISCPGDCSESYVWNTAVTLTATPTSPSTFAGWSGDCAGTATTCQVTMSQARSVTGTFDPPPPQTLTVAVNASGGATGNVTATGIDCPSGADCTETYAYGTVVTLTEAPGGSSIFTGWSGACTGTATTCQVTMTQARSVTANFTPPTQTLTVVKDGSGTGSITATGIACPGDCSQSYTWNTLVTLTATATSASTFAGWSGDCAGTATTCQVTMSQARNVTGSFDPPPPQTLTVAVNASGGATGNVTATGINCPSGADCTESYAYDTLVTLTEAPGGGSLFAGWSGACTGTATTCQVTMNQARSVTASFIPPAQTLTVTNAGGGTGSLTATGVACPSDCSESYAWNTVVTLTATPTAPSTFAGWSGDCTGTAATCQVTMSQARNVTGTFDPPPPQTLSVAVTGTGTGSVSGTGIACPGDCSESYAFGTVVTLTAAPAAGSALTGWSGACTGTALTCQVTMSQARSATATFAPSNALFKDGFESGNACAWSVRASAPCP